MHLDRTENLFLETVSLDISYGRNGGFCFRRAIYISNDLAVCSSAIFCQSSSHFSGCPIERLVWAMVGFKRAGMGKFISFAFGGFGSCVPKVHKLYPVNLRKISDI